MPWDITDDKPMLDQVSGTFRQQTITCANVDPVLCHNMASLTKPQRVKTLRILMQHYIILLFVYLREYPEVKQVKGKMVNKW